MMESFFIPFFFFSSLPFPFFLTFFNQKNKEKKGQRKLEKIKKDMSPCCPL